MAQLPFFKNVYEENKILLNFSLMFFGLNDSKITCTISIFKSFSVEISPRRVANNCFNSLVMGNKVYVFILFEKIIKDNFLRNSVFHFLGFLSYQE